MQRAQNEANSLLREQRHTDQPFRTRIAGIHAHCPALVGTSNFNQAKVGAHDHFGHAGADCVGQTKLALHMEIPDEKDAHRHRNRRSDCGACIGTVVQRKLWHWKCDQSACA